MLTLFALAAVTKFSGSDGLNPLIKNCTRQPKPTSKRQAKAIGKYLQTLDSMSDWMSSMNASTDMTPRSLLPRARTATVPAAFSLSPATRM
jgi:hypothetical protein